VPGTTGGKGGNGGGSALAAAAPVTANPSTATQTLALITDRAAFRSTPQITVKLQRVIAEPLRI
jgi:hypothetical protein